MYLFSHWPPLSLCNFFFEPPPPFQIQFSFVNPISLFLLIPPWNGAQNICSPLPPSYTPHLLPIWALSYDIWWGGQGKREEAEGEERKEVAGVGRGMKNVKILKGWKKGKFCVCCSEKGGGRQGAGGVRRTPPPPVHPLIFEKPAVTTLKNV